MSLLSAKPSPVLMLNQHSASLFADAALNHHLGSLAQEPERPLSELLSALPWPEKVKRCRVLLGHAHTRTHLAFFPDAVRHASERHRFLQAVFRDLHGIDPASWTISMQSAPPGEPVFACAVASSSLSALREFFALKRIQLTGVHAVFTALWNTLKPTMKLRDGAFVLAEDNRATIGLWQAGQWIAFRSQNIAMSDPSALAEILQLMMAAHRYTADRGHLFIAGRIASPASSLPTNWQCTQLAACKGMA